MKRKPILIFIGGAFFVLFFAFFYFSNSPTPPAIPYYSETVVNPRIVIRNGFFMLEYNYLGNSKRMTTYVGNSEVDLVPFINRYDVTITTSYPKKFVDASKFERKEQCIQKKCTKYSKDNDGSALVIDILDVQAL